MILVVSKAELHQDASDPVRGAAVGTGSLKIMAASQASGVYRPRIQNSIRTENIALASLDNVTLTLCLVALAVVFVSRVLSICARQRRERLSERSDG
ncbi:hypothetical protein [Kribbella sp. NPDC023855]|uniref:hypothetical protein n=1 Tax=Kribbella sp. NPDC023855 TaxID=3154698 RepID=UPI0033F359F6